MIIFGFSQYTAKKTDDPTQIHPVKCRVWITTWRYEDLTPPPKKKWCRNANHARFPGAKLLTSFQFIVNEIPSLKKKKYSTKSLSVFEMQIFQEEISYFFGGGDGFSELQSPVGFLGWSSTDTGDPGSFLAKNTIPGSKRCVWIIFDVPKLA